LRYISEGPFEHFSTLISLLIFTGVFYFIFAWFREQVCIIACPYGRLQGVLLDNKSIVVAYDHKRGEGEIGRAKFRKNEDRAALGKGDCIDCFQCVHVCPTGIDIRNGTKLECINCTAYMDACDSIMDAVGLPRGLIRYASEENIEKKAKFEFTPRLKGYTAVLVVLIGIVVGLLFLRSDVEATVLRIPGQLPEQLENNVMSNVFTYKLINKTTSEKRDIHFKLKSPKGEVKTVKKNEIVVPAQGLIGGTFFVEIPNTELKGNKNNIVIEIYSGETLVETTTATFLGRRSF